MICDAIERPRIFVSHTAKDKEFVRDLVWELRRFGYPVWFDEWEVAVGDSIVDKVFEGLRASDTLIVVLSPSSIKSRWVNEELSVAVMRRISESDIRVLPVLIENCEIPTSLRHIRYADYRDSREEGMSLLLEALTPGHALWKSLAHHYEHLDLLASHISSKPIDEATAVALTNLHDLLDTALNLRTEIELRHTRQRLGDLTFFDKIGLLVEKGVDVRSQTWNELVHFRAGLAHSIKHSLMYAELFARRLTERHAISDMREGMLRGMQRLRNIMQIICFERWDVEALRKDI